jgi:hypothetical protein
MNRQRYGSLTLVGLAVGIVAVLAAAGWESETSAEHLREVVKITNELKGRDLKGLGGKFSESNEESCKPKEVASLFWRVKRFDRLESVAESYLRCRLSATSTVDEFAVQRRLERMRALARSRAAAMDTGWEKFVRGALSWWAIVPLVAGAVLLLMQPGLAELGTLVGTALAMAGALAFVGLTAPSIEVMASEAYGVLSCLVAGGISLIVTAACGDLRDSQVKIREGILDAVVVMIKKD